MKRGNVVRLTASAGLVALLAGAASAIELERGTVSALGGFATGASMELGQTAGLPLSGRSETPDGHSVQFTGFWFPAWDVAVGTEAQRPVPRITRLTGSYPNPFNTTTRLRFELGSATEPLVATHLEVFDVKGRRVATLVEAELAPGRYEIAWDRRDAARREVAGGVYFARLTSGPYARTIRLVVAK